ncbi:MAG: hypothetical protein Q9174_003358, partial [Haloplaca sp. 1 TL-2023]
MLVKNSAAWTRPNIPYPTKSMTIPTSLFQLHALPPHPHPSISTTGLFNTHLSTRSLPSELSSLDTGIWSAVLGGWSHDTHSFTGVIPTTSRLLHISQMTKSSLEKKMEELATASNAAKGDGIIKGKGGKGKAGKMSKAEKELREEKKGLREGTVEQVKEIGGFQRTLRSNQAGMRFDESALLSPSHEECFVSLALPVSAELRLKLELPAPGLPYHPAFPVRMHLAGNAGAAIGLRFPLLGGEEPLFRVFTLRKGSAPVTWTVVSGNQALKVVTRVHDAMHLFPGPSAVHARLPPVLGGASPGFSAAGGVGGGAVVVGGGAAAAAGGLRRDAPTRASVGGASLAAVGGSAA